MDMLDEGAGTRSALEISDELERLGATLDIGAGLDTCEVSMSALKANLDDSLALFGDVILRPSFPQSDFDRLQKQQLATIASEKVSPVAMGLRILPALLYGAGHAYAAPLTGSGSEASVSSLTRDKLASFHANWFKPNNATLIVVGSVSLAEIRPKLETLLAGWRRGEAPAKKVAVVKGKGVNEVYLIDRPGSSQSVIFAGMLAPPKNDPDDVAIGAAHEVLGGSFTSRLNMNLREDKHWSYGARMMLLGARGQRLCFAMAPVQGDKTKEAVGEIVKELAEIIGSRPVSREELAKAQGNLTLTLPGRWETNRAVAASLSQIVQFGLPADYFDTYAAQVRGLDSAAVHAAARRLVPAMGIVFVIVGDRAKIEQGVRSLGLGAVTIVDADGKPTGS